MAVPTLTKSTFLTGLQCAKALWTTVHRPETVPPPDANALWRMREGIQVGALAQRCFPGGVKVGSPLDTDQALERTEALMRERVPLFEAAFRLESAAGSTVVRVDVLVPVGETAWSLVEVKGTTHLEDHHVWDVAIQRYVLEAVGVEVADCSVMHLNQHYKKDRNLDLTQLFVREPVDGLVEDCLTQIPGLLTDMFQVLVLPAVPDSDLGPHCNAPYGCALKEACWAILPERPITGLVSGGKRAWSLYLSGIRSRDDVPVGQKLSNRQCIQIQTERRGTPHIDRVQIRAFLDRLRYPLYHMDFETLSTAVPLFDGAWPYAQIPFQFSVHRQDQPGGPLEHFEFLADMEAAALIDPRPAFLAGLQVCLGYEGSIVVYHQSFEIGRLRECAAFLPEYADWYRDTIEPRIVDLIVPFRRFAYYHPAQEGSASIKRVLPALVGKGYEGMEIGDGQTAAREYMRVHLLSVSTEEKAAVRRQLQEYCELDTAAMAWIVDQLWESVGDADT